MNRCFTRWVRRLALPVVFALTAVVPSVSAQSAPPTQSAPPAQEEYLIGPDDVMSISVWMHPELERTLSVSSQGNITFPPIGEVKAAGLTAKQLSDRLSDRLSTYLRQTSTVTVTLTQFLSHSVYVSGAVARPGRYGFEHMPGLLDVISQAGGALPNADLSRVQVLRKDGATLQSMPADISTAVQSGTEMGLPSLMPGDAIVVPSSGISGAVTADAVGVMGEVNRPGIYGVGDGQDLWMVLAQAGGPTGRSDLTSIRVLSADRQDPTAAVRVNLQETLTKGNRSPFMVKPGDIVYITPRGGGWNTFLELLAITRDVVGTIAIVVALNHYHY
jgi:polysaccharide export outer membrane protein